YAPTSRFSRTVSDGNTWRPSGTCAIPRCARRAGGTPARSRPSKRIAPDVTGASPEIALNSVLLPAPFGPTTATSSPAPTRSDTPLSAGMRPYATRSSAISSIPFEPLPAEISLDHGRVARDRVRVAACEHRAVIEHDEAIDEPHHCVHRVLDDHDRDAEIGKARDQVDQLAYFVVREPCEDLVEQKQ